MNKKKFGKIVLSLIVAIVTFIGLLFMQRNILKPNGEVTMIVAKEKIDKRTLIDENNINELFVEKKIDGDLKVDNGVFKKSDLLNKVTDDYIEKNEILASSSFVEDTSLVDMKDPIEVSVRATDISQVVGGVIRANDKINISIINEITKQEEKVIDNVHVSRVFGSDGKEIKASESSSALNINIIIPKVDEKKINDKLGLGIVRVSRIR